MYFKIEKTSPLGQQIHELWLRIFASRERIKALAAELSDMENPRTFTSPNHVAGLLWGLQFKDHPGSKWAEITKHRDYGMRYFQPSTREYNKKNSELKEKWTSANDPISHADFCSLFGLKPGSAGGLTWYQAPGFNETPNFYVVLIDDEWAKTIKNRPADMVEILGSEYHQLLEEKKRAKETATP